MKKANKFDFKTLLVTVLSLCLCLSMTLFAACGDKPATKPDDGDKKEEEVYPTDTQMVTNGDFEFSTFKKKPEDFPVTSGFGWSRSSDYITTSSNPSSYDSGIVDTSDEKVDGKDGNYTVFAKKAGDLLKDGDNYFNPHTPAYYGLVENSYKYVKDDKDNKNDDKYPMLGSKVLMIHNEINASKGQGTAQKFTSNTTLNIDRHEYAKVSVWVLTHNLKSVVAEADYGAYVALQNTVNNSQDPLVIKNIETNDSWVKYSFYLEPSEIAVSSYKVVLGLGFGSSKLRSEYVEGFAFFDNVTYEIIDRETYLDNVNGKAAEGENPEIKKADVALNLFADADKLEQNEKAVVPAIDYVDTTAYAEVADGTFKKENVFTERKFVLSHVNHVLGVDDYFDFGDNAFTKNEFATVENQADGDCGTDTLATALNKVNGYRGAGNEIKAPFEGIGGNAIYFVHSKPTSYSYTTQKFVVNENDFVKVSFWVNAEVAYPAVDKALTITLNDLGAIDSDDSPLYENTEPVKKEIAASVHTVDEKNANFNNWREYTVFIKNTLNSDNAFDAANPNNNERREYTLTFDFGATGNSIADKEFGLTKGYAIVAGLNIYNISEEDYNLADDKTYSFAKKFELSADHKNGIDSEDKNNDNYNFNYGATDDVTIKNGVATNVVDYKGVVADSREVAGPNPSKYTAEGVEAGVINTQYIDSYGFSSDEKTAINNLGKIGENAYIQPLMINNKTANAFGFIGKNGTMAAHTTTVIEFKVRVFGDAVANFYIVNSNALDRFNVISLSAKDYDFADGVLTKKDTNKVNENLVVTIKASDFANAENLDDGWFKVRFVIVTGDDEITYRPEFWNGTRRTEGETAVVKSTGLVLIDEYKVSTSENLDVIKAKLGADYSYTFTDTEYTRIPTTIKYTDENGKDAIRYKEYKDPSVVFSAYKVDGMNKALIADYSDIVVEEEVDKRDETAEKPEDGETETPDAPENPTSFNWALQLTSIIIAVVLIVLLIILLIRSIVQKNKSKRSSSVSYYDRDSRDITGRKNEERKSQADDEDADDEKPYDYDNMENNIDADDKDND